MTGGDQVWKLHRSVDAADRGSDGAGVLEVLAGLSVPLGLSAVDLVTGDVVRHRLESGVRTPEHAGGHRRGYALVAGQLLHAPTLFCRT